MGKIKAICISKERGFQKHGIQNCMIKEDWGIENDAHAGKWHRQVSLLGYEEIEAFKKEGAEVKDGAFGENLVVEGFKLRELPIGTKFKVGEVILELTQIGKECHHGCEIMQKMGKCIMPSNGVFTKVLKGGYVEVGMDIDIVE